MTPVPAAILRPALHAARKADGFTLLEVLIATTLIGLLTTVLFGGLGFGSRAMHAGSRTADRASELAVGQGFLRDRLAAAENVAAPGHPDDTASRFQGTSDRVAFVGPVPPHLAWGGYQHLTIRLDRGPSARLMAEWQPFYRLGQQAFGQAPPENRSAVLFDNLANAEFAYFGAPEAGRPRQWHAAWSGRSSLPVLVRLRLAFADGRAAPDLVVALRLANEAPLPAHTSAMPPIGAQR